MIRSNLSRFLFRKNVAIPSSLISRTMSSKKVNVGGNSIHVEIVGEGDHAALLLPGALGTSKTDFEPQLEGLNSKGRFTLIAWDPPGYGNSRPPKRTWPLDFFHRDADMALKTMEALGHESFSMIGWSDGGITAMIAAAKSEKVKKLVVWGSNAYIAESDIQIIEKIRDVSQWSPRMREPMEKVYGKDYFPILWNEWSDAFVKIDKELKGDLCQHLLPLISCPTFIVHGDKDAMIAPEHPDFLHRRIKGSKLHRFPDGKHNLHFKYKDEFNRLVEDFLLEP